MRRNYPSVTNILRATSSFVPHDGKRKNSIIQSKKGERVHAQIESYLKRGDKSLGKHTAIKQIIPLLKLLKENAQSKLVIEEIIYSNKYQFQGKPDLICNFNNLTTVIDWAYSERPKQKEGLERKFLQTAAYAIAADEIGIKVEQLAVIVITDSPKTFQIFTEVPQLYRIDFLKRLGKYKNQQRKSCQENTSTGNQKKFRH